MRSHFFRFLFFIENFMKFAIFKFNDEAQVNHNRVNYVNKKISFRKTHQNFGS